MRVLAAVVSAAFWLLPGPILPTAPEGGPEAPPRPYGASPHPGPAPPATPRGIATAQTRRLRHGPFPSGGLMRGISEGVTLLDTAPPGREAVLERIRATGATVVRLGVNWRDYVEAAPGPGFQASDPSSPAYDFTPLDEAVRAVASAGLQPLLVVSHAPTFAEAPDRWHYAYLGSWSPNPTALGEFAAALARRYDGSFPDPAAPGTALPRVRLFQAWNEPNLAHYLEPQWIARGRQWQPFSPFAYRQLLNAFYEGVKSVEPSDVVAAAGLAPNGQRAGVGRMAPVTFLRWLLCVSSPETGHPACPEPAHLDAIAFHPLSVESPDLPASSALDVSVSDAAKVAWILRSAEAGKTVLPAGPKALWVTELDWETAPQVPWGVPPRLQAAWISRALHRLWVAGVSLVAWHFLIDPFPALRSGTPTGGVVEGQRPAGLYSAGPGGALALAAPKPFETGFALPFDPLRVSRSRVSVWALLTPRQRAIVERLKAGEWRPVATLRAGANGVLNRAVPLRGRVTLRLRAGALVSASASVGPRA